MPSLRDWWGRVLHDMPQPGNRLCTWPARLAIGVSVCMTTVMGCGIRGKVTRTDRPSLSGASAGVLQIEGQFSPAPGNARDDPVSAGLLGIGQHQIAMVDIP